MLSVGFGEIIKQRSQKFKWTDTRPNVNNLAAKVLLISYVFRSWIISKGLCEKGLKRSF